MRNTVFVSLLTVAEGVAFVHPTHSRRSRNLDNGDHRRVVATSFSKNGDNSDSGKDSGSNSAKDSSDFPTWVKALIRWDSSEKASSSNSNAQKADGGTTPFHSFPFAIGGNKRNSGMWEEQMSPAVASLSGMVNVEALVAAANETEEEAYDLLKQTIDTEATNGKINGNGKEDSRSSSAKLFSFLDNALRWDELVRNVQELTDPGDGLNVTFEELVNMVPENGLLSDELKLVENDQATGSSSPFNTAATTEKILQEATQRLDFLINETSYAFSPSVFQSLILRASKALAIEETSGNITAAALEIFEQAGKAPRATAEYTAELVQFANGVLVGGYEPLFRNYPSVKNIPAQEQKQKIVKAAEFASLSGAIYEDAISNTLDVGHSIVAQGNTADIGWMVTDSIQYEQDFWSDSKENKPTLVRTFVLRGYDASDEDVDREGLLNVICTASPVPICKNDKALVQVHEGMLSMAQQLLQELEKYIDTTSPSHKFVFTG